MRKITVRQLVIDPKIDRIFLIDNKGRVWIKWTFSSTNLWALVDLPDEPAQEKPNHHN